MLKRNIKLVFSTNALMLASGVVTSLLGAWALGPSGRGDLAAILMWPGVFAMVAEIGLPTAYKFWTAKEPERVSALFSNAVLLTAVIGLAMLALAWLLIPSLIGDRTPTVLRLAQIYSVVVPMTLLTNLIRGLLEGARRFQWVAALRLIFFGFQSACYSVLWLSGRLTLTSAMYVMIGSSLLSVLVALIAIRRELKPRWAPRFADFKQTFRFGVRDYPGILTEFINWRLDLLVLTAVSSSLAIGLYSVAVKLSDITTVLASSVGDALLPEVAATSKEEDATAIVTRSLRMTLGAHLLLLVPLWIMAPYILRFAYGSAFVPVANVLRLLMIASVIWSGGAILISGLNGLGHPGLSTTARLSAALVMIVTLIMWLPKWGIRGAALASITGYSVMFVVALFWFLRQQKIGLWECVRPRRDDIPPILYPHNLKQVLYRFLGRSHGPQTPAGEVLVSNAE
jgi:O-antigen/teichoic acid export membrane protein